MLIVIWTSSLKAVRLFEKYHNMKIMTNWARRYPSKGPFGCEKLCLEMADLCAAVNVLYTNHQYVCDVMDTFPFSNGELEKLMTGNRNGKLIIKQG